MFITYKKCTKCLIDKPNTLQYFSKDYNTNRIGRRCIKCRSKAAKERYHKSESTRQRICSISKKYRNTTNGQIMYKKNRAKLKNETKYLTDEYIIFSLAQILNTKISELHLSKEIIEAKRQQLLLHRQLKNHKNHD